MTIYLYTLNQVKVILVAGRLGTFVFGLTISVCPTVFNGFLQLDQHSLVFRVHRHHSKIIFTIFSIKYSLKCYTRRNVNSRYTLDRTITTEILLYHDSEIT